MKQLPVDEVRNSSFCLHITSCRSMEAWLGWSDSLLPFKTTIIWSVASQESHENCCHQILRLKCTKFDLCWGSAPDPAGRAYSAPPDPLDGFKGPYF